MQPSFTLAGDPDLYQLAQHSPVFLRKFIYASLLLLSNKRESNLRSHFELEDSVLCCSRLLSWVWVGFLFRDSLTVGTSAPLYTPAGYMAFFQRVLSYVFNEVLVNTLANSKAFQRFAVKTTHLVEEMSKKGRDCPQCG